MHRFLFHNSFSSMTMVTQLVVLKYTFTSADDDDVGPNSLLLTSSVEKCFDLFHILMIVGMHNVIIVMTGQPHM